MLNKAERLNDDDWRYIAAHPWLGVLALFQLRGQQELPYRAMIVAHEHHMKSDLTGYPQTVRARAISIFSKIVAVADGFDAATSRRVVSDDAAVRPRRSCRRCATIRGAASIRSSSRRSST